MNNYLRIALACVAFAVQSTAHAQVTWTPFSIDWVCNYQSSSGNTKCNMVVFGDDVAPSLTSPVVAKAFYRIRKGQIAGEGPFVAIAPVEALCTRYPPYLQCVANDLITLGPGVFPSINSTAVTLDINIYSQTPTPLFDLDGDNTVTQTDGMMVLRYLAGYKGSAITNGFALTNGRTVATVEAELEKGVAYGWFNLMDRNVARLNAVRDGNLVMRCLRGLRGTALTAGESGNTTIANTKCLHLVTKN